MPVPSASTPPLTAALSRLLRAGPVGSALATARTRPLDTGADPPGSSSTSTDPDPAGSGFSSGSADTSLDYAARVFTTPG